MIRGKHSPLIPASQSQTTCFSARRRQLQDLQTKALTLETLATDAEAFQV